MRFFVSLVIIFFLGTAAYGDKPLRVGVVVDPPFVIKTDVGYTGIAIDLWNEIAQGLRQKFTFVERCCADTDAPFEAFEKNEVDVLIGSLSITQDRYKKADFTLPIFIDKVVALSSFDCFHSALSFLRIVFISIGWIIAIFISLFMLYIHLLWYYEKSYTRNFPTTYKAGISHLFWAHVLSGHHTEIPKSKGGKIVILCHKTFFYFIIVILNATLISVLTVSLSHYAQPIQSLGDLEKHKVGAIKNSKAFNVGEHFGVKLTSFSSLEEGIKAVQEGKVYAFLAELADAEYYLKKHEITHLNASHFDLNHDLYAFAVTVGSPLLREINLQILQLRERDIPQKICKAYFSTGAKNCRL